MPTGCDWVILHPYDPSTFLCTRCGKTYRPECYPIRLTLWIECAGYFQDSHAKCEDRRAQPV
jgi:hypothetical protein